MSDNLNVWTIPSGLPFLEILADEVNSGQKLLPFASTDQIDRTNLLILLPTRRACRELTKLISERSPNRAALLPDIRAIGDVGQLDLPLNEYDESQEPDFPSELETSTLPPALGGMERQLILARLIDKWLKFSSDIRPTDSRVQIVPTASIALRLASDLASLMDQLDNEDVSYSSLKNIVPEEHALHWELNFEFLKIISENWTDILKERAAISPVERRSMQLADVSKSFLKNNDLRVLAAGSTGSVPASARLLKTIASMPSGSVVLPGLDQDLDETDWQEVLHTPSHPQHGLANFITFLGVERQDVRTVGAEQVEPALKARNLLSSEFMRTQKTVSNWQNLANEKNVERFTEAYKGLQLIEAKNPEQEALVIALKLREVLEAEDTTAALITPDRTLARRVQTELLRWNIRVDDSAGVPLSGTPEGIFARLVAGMFSGKLSNSDLLAMLKHPLTFLQLDNEAKETAISLLETQVLRNPRANSKPQDLEELFALLTCEDYLEVLGEVGLQNIQTILQQIKSVLGSINEGSRSNDLATYLKIHFEVCLKLSTACDGDVKVFNSHAGLGLQNLFEELIASATQFDDWHVDASNYAEFFTTSMTGRPVRNPPTFSDRVMIWGPLEARLLTADLIILSGLNEGMWPAESDTGPWLPRNLREKLGLPPLERRIGQSAHDFVQAFANSEVLLTRSVKSGGSPTVPSRWLQRLKAVTSALDATHLLQPSTDFIERIAARLDHPEDWTPIEPARPTPPLNVRPRQMSVTEIEALIRDPYSIYAHRILSLNKLPELDAELDASDRGVLFHRAMQIFIERKEKQPQTDELSMLIEIGDELFDSLSDKAESRELWRLRFGRMARWFVEANQDISRDVIRSECEVKGSLNFRTAGGNFVLTARADRIDVLQSGIINLYDYKTGNAPTPAQVESGLSPQLALEAAIASENGFRSGRIKDKSVLAFIEITGGKQPGQIKSANKMPVGDLVAKTFNNLKARVEAFENPNQSYMSRIAPMYDWIEGDFDHLARVKEWSRVDAGGGNDS